MSNYAHPEVLVSTDWVSQHHNDANVRLVEVDVDTKAHEEGHIPGAIAWNWTTQLADTVTRDILSKAQIEKLFQESGIGNGTTIVLYGDNNNWFAAWAFWEAKIYGHKDVRIMNGGRKKWLAEGREVTQDKPEVTSTTYSASNPDLSLRAVLSQVKDALSKGGYGFVDVRSPQEFTGELLAPPGLPETCQRGGHLPGASSIPWGKAANEDGTFKSFDELKQLYAAEGIDGNKPVITYCRIGERSSHSWFVLKYLLGYPDITNYDGSWTEWGNLVGAAVEKGAARGAAKA